MIEKIPNGFYRRELISMAQIPAANEVTLRELRESFGLKFAEDVNFFSEWSAADVPLSQTEQQFLDRVKGNFVGLMTDPSMLENSVKMRVDSELY